MAQFMGSLITVGGEGAVGGVDITGEVYRFKEESQEWEEFLKHMSTDRFYLSAATTQSAIIASGGVTGTGCLPSPLLTPATSWGELTLITTM